MNNAHLTFEETLQQAPEDEALRNASCVSLWAMDKNGNDDGSGLLSHFRY